ncbi:ROK family protein [Georgenia sp. TF02-10]|uniref:ROK family transcriptional regulator n=1 Tax=Georgenia sp. TF02-10 TaxID=2917725 RepID=UPI001FA7FF96|nr:ROK family protein [Georgenia sp. TF02-10]UNX55687.1 ROK family protein [Georgenia sp. TF02-10]
MTAVAPRPPAGPGELLDLIRRQGGRTRAEIQAATGLSRMTVGQRLAPLLAEGLVRETDPQDSTGGRRPRGLEFNPGNGVVVVGALETTGSRTAVTDLAGRVLARAEPAVSVQAGPRDTLDAIVASARQLLAADAVAGLPLHGAGLSLPGPVDPATGRPSEPPIMPGWDAYPVADHLADALGVPAVAENDANAMAVGEFSAHHPESAALALLKVSTGIGAGLVLDGRLFRGVDGGAGDIGHVRLADHPDALCRCGARGCLAAVASGWAVARELTARGLPATSGRDVRALLADGNPDAERLTRAAGRLIGEVAATVVSVVNPDLLVLGGDLASTALLGGVRETLYARSLPRATRHLHVVLSGLGQDAALIGMTRTVVDLVFDPAAVNERLAQSRTGA